MPAVPQRIGNPMPGRENGRQSTWILHPSWSPVLRLRAMISSYIKCNRLNIHLLTVARTASTTITTRHSNNNNNNLMTPKLLEIRRKRSTNPEKTLAWKSPQDPGLHLILISVPKFNRVQNIANHRLILTKQLNEFQMPTEIRHL